MGSEHSKKSGSMVTWDSDSNALKLKIVFNFLQFLLLIAQLV